MLPANLAASQSDALRSLHRLLRMSQVRVTRTTLRNRLGQHGEFPSLRSLSDTLDDLRIRNSAVQIAPQLAEIPLPALAHLTSEGGFFAPMRATTPQWVEWWHPRRGWQREDLQRFTQHWRGTVLLLEPTAASGELNYAAQRRQEWLTRLRVPFALFALLACLGAWESFFHRALAAGPVYYWLLGTKLLGLSVSSLLVWRDLDATNAFLHSICQLSARTNCGAVLNAPAARLFGWLSWAEIGLFYFGGGLLSLLLFPSRLPLLYPLLGGLTLAALPYSGWSIYYQWRHVGQWCVLCLVVQATLWLEAGVLAYFQRLPAWPLPASAAETALFSTGFLLLPALWALLKPGLQRASRAADLQQRLQALKFSPIYLGALRQRLRTAPALSAGMRLPTIGPPDAPHQLLVVTNPTCAACVRVHQELEEMVAGWTDVCCQFVLAVSPGPGGVSAAVATQLLRQPPATMPHALRTWYATFNLEKWLAKTQPPAQALPDAEAQLALHQQWCAQAGVQATPTLFFDGAEIPRHYSPLEIRQLARLFDTQRS